tara:strand:- start:2431 stop:2952 length:522 start_codon:yes stop_codon:yes gene_type:complete
LIFGSQDSINTITVGGYMAYSKEVVKRFEEVTNNPAAHGVGRFDPKDPNVATGLTGAPACGDVMKLDLKLNPETDVIEDVKFKTYGCGSAIASSSMFVEMLTGLTIEEAKQIKDKDIATALELPPIKIHCSVLAEDSIKKAIEDWEEKKAGRNSTWMEKMGAKPRDGETIAGQ